MENDLIKVGMMVSYDWVLLKNSIHRIYESADKIVLALDRERRTWAGNKFEIPNTFFQWIKTIDEKQKIEIYEDDFFVPHLSPMENDTRERNLLAKYMGEGGWHLQIDSDEYFLDFNAFISRLKKLSLDEPTTVFCRLLPLIKKTNCGYLCVDFKNANYETFPVATNRPEYINARHNEAPIVFFDDIVVHETWARSNEELKSKLNNWGHRDDFDVESYYNLWLALDEHNYKYISNFHPLEPPFWPYLKFVPGQDIDSCIENILGDHIKNDSAEPEAGKSIVGRVAANIIKFLKKHETK